MGLLSVISHDVISVIEITSSCVSAGNINLYIIASSYGDRNLRSGN